MPDRVSSEVDHLAISVRYTDPAMDMGTVAVSRLFLWFHPYLRGLDDERLDPRQTFFLQFILGEAMGPENPTFHLEDLPCPFPFKTRENYVTHFRQMGLFYTKAIYKAELTPGRRGPGHPPIRHVDHVEWFFDPLFFSLGLVYQKWRTERDALKARLGKAQVFYRLPDDYTQTVEIPPHLMDLVARSRATHKGDLAAALKRHPKLAEQIVALAHRPAPKRSEEKGFFRISPIIILRATEQQARRANAAVAGQLGLDLATSESALIPRPPDYGDLGSPALPSPPDLGKLGKYRESPITGNWEHRPPHSGGVLVPSTTTIANSKILKTFAAAVGVETYTPTPKDKQVISALRREGFTEDQIGAGIVRAIEIARASAKTVRTIAYCAPVIRKLSASTDRETREPSAVSGQPPAVPADSTEESPIATHLIPLAEGDAELLVLLRLVQAKNVHWLDAADVSAWRTLAVQSWVGELAKKNSVTAFTLVTQAVQEAISAGSVTKKFLAPKLAERVLTTWREHGRAERPETRPAAPRRIQTPPRPSGLQYDSLEEYAQSMERQLKALSTPSDPSTSKSEA